MVKIRLTRTGKKNFATYRVVVVDAKKKRDTDFIEDLGFYQPHSKQFSVNTDRVQYWIGVGAQPSPTVARQLVKAELLAKNAIATPKFAKKAGKKSQERTAAKAEKAAKPAQEAPAAPAESE